MTKRKIIVSTMSKSEMIIHLYSDLCRESMRAMPSKENPWISQAYLNSLSGEDKVIFGKIRLFRNQFVFNTTLPHVTDEVEEWMEFLKKEIKKLKEMGN